MKRPARPTKDVTAAFTSRGKTDLYEWLWSNFDLLPPYQRYRVSWQKLVKALTDLRINARDESKPLNVDIVRKTYERVKADRAAAETAVTRSVSPASNRAAARQTVQGPAPAIASPAPSGEADYEPLPKPTWTPTRLK